MTIYNPSAKYFVPLFPAGALFAEEAIHPFIIIRAQHLSDRQCSRLGGCIKELLGARAMAQERCDAEMTRLANAAAEIAGFTEGEMEGWSAAERAGFTEGEVGGGGPVRGDVENAGPNGDDILEWSNNGSGADVRVMAIFDEDPKDGDYTYQTSDGRSTEEEGESTEEEEAMETDYEGGKSVIDLTNDEEEEKAVEKAVIDLTGLSDNGSVCSQEL